MEVRSCSRSARTPPRSLRDSATQGETSSACTSNRAELSQLKALKIIGQTPDLFGQFAQLGAPQRAFHTTRDLGEYWKSKRGSVFEIVGNPSDALQVGCG